MLQLAPELQLTPACAVHMGICCSQTNGVSLGRYVTAFVTWSSLAGIGVLLFCVRPYFDEPTSPHSQYQPLVSALYASLSPVLWSGCLLALTAGLTLGEHSEYEYASTLSNQNVDAILVHRPVC